MMSGVTQLSSPLQPDCIQQQLLWVTLKRGIRGLIPVPACKSNKCISQTVILNHILYKCLENTQNLSEVLSRYMRTRGELGELYALPRLSEFFPRTVQCKQHSLTNSRTWYARANGCSNRFIIFQCLSSSTIHPSCLYLYESVPEQPLAWKVEHHHGQRLVDKGWELIFLRNSVSPVPERVRRCSQSVVLLNSSTSFDNLIVFL